ncbi:hypothetical protein HUJ05_006907 [Dendroctonus ponderosae]|nr:hypothetical protein HUJ05_006907 [Dendroctonus ponderosae]
MVKKLVLCKCRACGHNPMKNPVSKRANKQTEKYSRHDRREAPQFFDRTLSRKPQTGSRSKPLHTPKQVFGGSSFSSGDVDSIWLLTPAGRRRETMQLPKIMGKWESSTQLNCCLHRKHLIWSVTSKKTCIFHWQKPGLPMVRSEQGRAMTKDPIDVYR